MSCSTMTTVIPIRRRMSSIRNRMSRVSSGESPEAGSSMRISFGSMASARPTSTTLRTP